MKVFISQPMANRTNEEIIAERNNTIEYVKSVLETEEMEIEFIDSFCTNISSDAKPLYYLGKSFELLSMADLAVFVEGWSDCRGCILEYFASNYYGIDILDLEERNE